VTVEQRGTNIWYPAVRSALDVLRGPSAVGGVHRAFAEDGAATRSTCGIIAA